MLKNIIFSFLFFSFFFSFTKVSFSQIIKYVDMKLVIEKMPEYEQANQLLEALTKQWDLSLKQLSDSIEMLKKDFERDEIFLSQELKKSKQEVISSLEKEYEESQKRYFGFEGELFKKRIELIRPIQDKIYAAIEKIASLRAIDIIFDKNESNSIIFARPELDITSLILKELGISNN